jgi:two-component system, NtrC family, response regulator AtoC
MGIEKILVVDDEMLIRTFLEETLSRKKYEVQTASSVKPALQILKKTTFDLVITDMKMPDGTGIDVLKAVKKFSPETLVIIITAFGSIENAVEAMHLGSYNYLIKPFSPDTIEAVIEKAEEHLSLLEENRYLKEEIQRKTKYSEHTIIAESPAMKKILQEVEHIAKSNANVFINGESGTGKEVIAKAIHQYSPRIKAPYICVNCAAMPESLIESELFGHEKGAFTGAQLKRIGRFELANGGSLLLDEITEVPIALQPKLLRVIQEKQFERVGGTKSIDINVRFISTSNRVMKEAIANNIFREDLYYRLNVIPIHLPPLRERSEDIIPLAYYFMKKFCIENNTPIKTLSKCAKTQLLDYHWPGNIRELGNLMERLVVMNPDKTIHSGQLYLEKENISHVSKIEMPIGMSLQELEKKMIIETLQQQKENHKQAAELLGINVRTLKNKLNDYNQNN